MNTKQIEVTIKAIADVDERLALYLEKVSELQPYKVAMDIASGLFKEEDSKDIFKKSKYIKLLEAYVNNVNIIKTKKLIYKTLLNPNKKREVFQKLLTKYDELIGISYDISNNLVLEGLELEGDYIEYCQKSLSQREYIQTLCKFGESICV